MSVAGARFIALKRDPQGAKIQRWMDVAPTSATGEALGVVALTLPLASEPVLGDYTISAEVAGADAATATFLVDRYVVAMLPVVAFGTITEGSLTAELGVRYTSEEDQVTVIVMNMLVRTTCTLWIPAEFFYFWTEFV